LRPTVAAKRRSRGHCQPPAWRARACLCDRRPHHPVARCAARQDRRRMHRCAARQTLRRAEPDRRRAMTAPIKHSDAINVDGALGERAYDIVIGRDVLQSLGPRIAAMRPGARTAIVTDRTVAKHWLAPSEASLAKAGVPASSIVVEEGEGSKS